MKKYEIKEVLRDMKRKELNVISKFVGCNARNYLKDELIEELAISLETEQNVNDFKLSKEVLIKMSKGETIQEEIENIDALEEACVDIDKNSFTTVEDKEVESKLNVTVNFEMLNRIIPVVLAKIKAVQKNYDFNEQPYIILHDVCEGLRIEDRAIDIAYYLTYGKPEGIDDIRYTCQFGDITIINEYNAQQNARRELAINNSLMNKAPTEKQLGALNNVLELLNKSEEDVSETVNFINETMCDFNASALDVKIAIEKGYKALGNLKPSDNQVNLINSMKRLGIGAGETPDTYNKARDFITKNMPLFNRKQLISNLNVQGIFGVDMNTIKDFDDEKVKNTLFSVKRLNNMLGLVFKFYKENIWTLIDKLNNMNPTDLLNLQKACLDKDQELIEIEMKQYDKR